MTENSSAKRCRNARAMNLLMVIHIVSADRVVTAGYNEFLHRFTSFELSCVPESSVVSAET